MSVPGVDVFVVQVQAGVIDARPLLQIASPEGYLESTWRRCRGERSEGGFRCTRDSSAADLGEFLAFLWLHDHKSRPKAQRLSETLAKQVNMQLHRALPKPAPKASLKKTLHIPRFLQLCCVVCAGRLPTEAVALRRPPAYAASWPEGCEEGCRDDGARPGGACVLPLVPERRPGLGRLRKL